MIGNKHRPQKFLRLSIFEHGEPESVVVVRTKYVKYVELTGEPAPKSYGVIFVGMWTGQDTYGFATCGDLMDCGIPFPLSDSVWLRASTPVL